MDSSVGNYPASNLYADVVGQEDAVSLLRAASRQPVHAYLFQGLNGAGPRRAVKAFAASLLCPEGGCGHCSHCQRALAGIHPDFVILERVGASLAVDEARHLVTLAQRRPLEAARQVLVLTDVHLAARSIPVLLKTLEEPPGPTVFVLLADDLSPDLDTVASRCVKVVFPPVKQSTVLEWLISRGVAAEKAALVAESCGGDIDRAELLSDDERFVSRLELWRSVPDALSGSGSECARLARILLEAADSALEPLRARHGEELDSFDEDSKVLRDRSVARRKEISDRHRREERRWRVEEIRSGMGVLARVYRDRILSLLRRRDGSETVGVLRCQEAISLVTDASRSLVRNPNETLLLESLFVKLTTLEL
ncbi:MAG: hypothetical protein M1134_06105 [Actinobacteria bacterium]|nr:hypothetical protein [Actinomycetota bacterium]MCL5444527.1 hypothetical protein [Actinomycetota bacterium]